MNMTARDGKGGNGTHRGNDRETNHGNGNGTNRRRGKGRRWLAPWKDSVERPVIYHCVTRVVDRRFAFEQADKEKFRTLMRMQE